MNLTNITATAPETDNLITYNYLNNYFMNPYVIILIVLIIIGVYMFNSSLGNDNDNLFDKPSSNPETKIMVFIVIFILVMLILFNALQYFFSIDVTAYIQGFFTPTPKIDIVIDQSKIIPSATIPEIKFKKQVFNIPGNYYNYENADALCQSYGAKLASYEQIEQAYNNGAEWCNYGWSANQLALFPTQMQTYNNLQKKKGHENDCGRPGVNGGFIANPQVQFGVNCYGYKPKISKEEDELMKTIPVYPETAEDLALQKRIDFWKKRIDDILVSPFNHNMWSSI